MMPASAGSRRHVSFRRVRKTYDGRTLVVSDLDLDVARGEFLTLLGPSGSGKTTTLMMLAGFETVTEGDILVDDRPIQALPPHKRGIGVVFQNYALFPHMSVAENVAFPLEVRGLSRAEREAGVRAALDLVRLGSLGGRRPAELSGGQQQRVALARALVFKPDLIVLDEPLGALDRQLREQMQYELKRIHGELGVTMIYVTHDQLEALTMSDRVAVFEGGRLQQIGAPQELYAAPEGVFVAGFLGENNLLPGEVSSSSNGTCRVAVDGLGEVEAVRGTGVAVGARVRVAVRPERVRLGAAAADCDCVAPATLRQAVFLGDQIRLELRVTGGTDILVKAPNVAGQRDLAPGAPTQIGFDAVDARALQG